MFSDLSVFTSPTKGELAFPGVIREVSEFIEEEPSRAYKLIVGTDSSEAREETDFVSVIVVHRIGARARYFWIRTRQNRMPSLRQRIYHEASLSLALAQELTQGVGESLNGYLTSGVCQLEVHVDIGQFGATRDMIKEVVGMILGNGFAVKIKPESYAASSVADKHV
ncbi:MAG: ribonuclease H-like YkuK family protein [bacterium]|nr:ribonuclease H-like YkuK family protein [bacterium]